MLSKRAGNAPGVYVGAGVVAVVFEAEARVVVTAICGGGFVPADPRSWFFDLAVGADGTLALVDAVLVLYPVNQERRETVRTIIFRKTNTLTDITILHKNSFNNSVDLETTKTSSSSHCR
ncbi:hypothetical protein HOY82DRAFT_596304 [Tuber indicum]|nr:hypothetical protein HOY82DRAFT_596304 [Tuber indicum]